MKIEMIARKQTEYHEHGKNGSHLKVTFLSSMGEKINFEISDNQIQKIIKRASFQDNIKISIEVEDEKLI
jgi:hypothetical protein